MKPRLPERPRRHLTMSKPRHLFESLHEGLKVGAFRLRLHESMEMIGHQAVRKNRTFEMGSIVQKLRNDFTCD